jgi:hypothetical protein
MTHRPPPQTYDNGLETNLYEIAEQICSKPPQPPCSIQLIMDHDTDTVVENEIETELLYEFTRACIGILFGRDKSPQDLSLHDLEKLKQYVLSVGYILNVNKEETATAYMFHISFERYVLGGQKQKNNPLEHLRKYMS